MDYQRYKPKNERPSGRGAFFDYALAMARRLESLARARRARKKSLEAARPRQSGEERWDGEGGNTETRIAAKEPQ